MAEEEICQNPPKNKIGKLKDQEEEEEDHISWLPDCLLIDIISRLPETKYAIRTGTLSKRWRHLWPYVHNLIFIFYMDSFTNFIWTGWNHQLLSEYVSFVEKTLTQCPHLDLNKFQLRIPYDVSFESQVNIWVRRALSCNVQDLNLSTLSNETIESEFVLDQCFFINSSFKYLRLEGCVLNPVGAISWSNLNTLFIGKQNLDEDLIQNILSGCPLLETLQLYECYGHERIDITSKSVKNFVFSGYDRPEDQDLDDIIEINAPYIVSLRITGYLLLYRLLLLNVSSLVKANLDYIKMGHTETTRKEGKEEMLIEFIHSLSHVAHVEELKIGFSCVNTLSRLEAKGFVLPLNLKVVDYDSLVSSDSDSDGYLTESGDSDGDSEELLLDDGLESEGGNID